MRESGGVALEEGHRVISLCGWPLGEPSRCLRSTAIRPLHVACKSASRGITMARLRTSILELQLQCASTMASNSRSYTFAKSLDTRSFDPAFSTVPTGRSQSSANIPFNNQDRSRNYARSDFDRRHALQGDFVWDLHSAMAVCGLTKMDGSTAWWAGGRLPAFLRFSPDVPSLGTVVGTLSTTRF